MARRAATVAAAQVSLEEDTGLASATHTGTGTDPYMVPDDGENGEDGDDGDDGGDREDGEDGEEEEDGEDAFEEVDGYNGSQDEFDARIRIDV